MPQGVPCCHGLMPVSWLAWGIGGRVPLVFSLPPHCSSAGRFWVTAAHEGPCSCSFPVSSGLWPSASLAVSHTDHGLYTPSLTQRPSREDIRGSSGARSQAGSREQYSLRQRPGSLLGPRLLSLPPPPSTSPRSQGPPLKPQTGASCSDVFRHFWGLGPLCFSPVRAESKRKRQLTQTKLCRVERPAFLSLCPNPPRNLQRFGGSAEVESDIREISLWLLPSFLPSWPPSRFPSPFTSHIECSSIKGALKTPTPEIADWRLTVQNMLYLALPLFKKNLSQHFENWEILHKNSQSSFLRKLRSDNTGPVGPPGPSWRR